MGARANHDILIRPLRMYLQSYNSMRRLRALLESPIVITQDDRRLLLLLLLVLVGICPREQVNWSCGLSVTSHSGGGGKAPLAPAPKSATAI